MNTACRRQEIHWVQAGEEHPGRKDRVDFEMPAGVSNGEQAGHDAKRHD